MSQARTARRRRKQLVNNNSQWSGLGVPRYGRSKDKDAQARRLARKQMQWAKTGSSLAGSRGKR
jgi:hypothetical protein